MLIGKYKYGNEMFSLRGYDFQTYFEFLIQREQEVLDFDEDESNNLFHLIIKPTNIQYAGGKQSSEVHKIFSELASFLFTAKSICVRENEEGYYDISFEETFNSLKKYNKDYDNFSFEISQKMGTVISCKVESQFYTALDLKEVDRSEKMPWIDAKHTMQYKNMFRDLITQKKTESGVLGAFKTIEEIIADNPDRNFDYILKKDLRFVTRETFKKVMSKIDKDIPFAVDTETDGLKINFKKGDKLVGLILTPDNEEEISYYFPFRHEDESIENLCEEYEIEDFFDKHFKDLLETGKAIYQNGSFDWKVLKTEGISARIFFDTLTAFRLTLWNEDRTLSLGLKHLAKRFLGHDSLELDDLVVGGWNNSLSFRQVPRELVRLYGCMDGVNTLALYKYILKENLLEYYNATRVFKLECTFSECVGYQEYYGHHVDIDNLPEIRRHLTEEKDALYEKMKELAGGLEFNPGSTKDLQNILFKILGLTPVSMTESGSPSTNKESLKILAMKHEFPRILLKYREIATQLNNFMNKIGGIATEDGFLFSSVQQFLETGRLSVSDPNYQSYAPAVKKYVTPREGYYMFDFDYSAVEYRIMSSMSKEDVLIEKFHDPDTDIHSYQASRMFGVPLLYITHRLRSQSKGVSFGLMYGMGTQSLGAEIFGKESKENTAKADNLMRLFFKGQEKVKAFFDNAQEMSYRDGWSDTFIGRRRYFNKAKYNAHKIMRMGANHRIQGTAADLFKLAMNRLFKMIKEMNWEGKVLIPFFVHDEAVLEVHKSIDPAILLKKVMECTRLYIKNWCPLTNEFGYGFNWYEAKSGECPVPVQDIIINKYGDSGLDWWDGDIQKLVDFQVGEIHKWQLSRVVDFLKDEKNHGKEVYPPVLKQGQSLYKDILKGDTRGINPVMSAEGFVFDKEKPINNLKGLVKLMGIQELYDNAHIVEEAIKVEVADTKPEPIVEEDFYNPPNNLYDMVELFGVYRTTDQDELWIKYPELWLDSNQAVVVLSKLESIFKNNPGDIKVFFKANKDIFEVEEMGISNLGAIEASKYIRNIWR